MISLLPQGQHQETAAKDQTEPRTIGLFPAQLDILDQIAFQEDQEDQLYLDVKYRKLWFRLANPLGRISSHIVWFNENVALAEAKIYLNYTDAPENYIANAFSMKFRSEDPKFGDKFLEMAETAPWDVRSLMRVMASSLRT